LQTLRLDNNEITEIKGLENLTNLRSLYIGFNHLTEIKNLENLTNLEVLFLDVNEVKEIKNIEKLQKLRELNVKNNKIAEIESLENIVNLKNLNIYNNPIYEMLKDKINILDPRIVLKYLQNPDDEISEEFKPKSKIKKLSLKKIIEVRGLKKYFGDVRAVDGISFDVYSGEVFGLLGPNGAGKTTTIKLLLGLLQATDGKSTVFGLDTERDEVQIKKRVGYVSEEPLIFKSLTPKDLFNFIVSIRELDTLESTNLVKEYLYSLEAAEYYEQLIVTLSHGNKQKIQIIAALLHDPDLLIMDEPLSGLDAKSVKVVKKIIELHAQKGGAVLFSTHIMEIAQELCDRIGIINKGKLVGMGTIEELRQQADKIGGASLEDVFLRLTEQDASVDEIIKKLRLSYKKTFARENI
jgi:ABC-2 type transport system ATP-binding protein